LVTFDISNPANPVQVSSIGTNLNIPVRVYVQGNYAYVSNQNAGVAIFDVTNPSSPVAQANLTTDISGPRYTVVQGRYAYIASTGNCSIVIYDISNPTTANSAEKGKYVDGNGTDCTTIPPTYINAPVRLAVQGRYLYTGGRDNGTFVVFDVSNPSKPVVVGSTTAGLVTGSNNGMRGLFVSGRYAYVTGASNSALVVYDMGGTYSSNLESGSAELGSLSVDSNAIFAADVNIQGGTTIGGPLQVGGSVGITSSGTGTSALSISNSTTGASLLDVKDLSQTFGGLATSGAFVSNMSYLGEEFNSDAQNTAITANATVGDDNRSNFRTTGATATYSTPRAVNGLSRLIYGTTSVVGSMVSYGTSTTNGTAIDATLKTSNLPVMQTKFIPVQSGNALTINTDYFIGMMDTTTPPTTNNTLPANGVLLWTNNSIPASGGTLALQGIVRSGSATVGTPVTCSGAYTFGNSIVARILVTDTTHADFQIDFNAGDGINFTDCGVVTGTFPTAQLSPEFIGIHNETTARQFDIDYWRIWQDDNSSADTTTDSTDATDASTTTDMSTPPLTADDATTTTDQIGIIDFTTATSEDTVIKGDLYVHGTIYADKIKANEIEGLSVFTDQLASLQQKLNEASSTSTNPDGTTTTNTIIQTATTTLNLSDGLTVGGDANFHGNVFFYKLVTFTEKTLFNNDVTFAAHITTDGAAPTYNLEAGAGEVNGVTYQAAASIDGNDNSGSLSVTAGDNPAAGKVISVTFAKPYAKAPRVILSATNDQAAGVKYYVQSTATGFAIYVVDPPTSGANLQFNYFVIQ